jgi:hypothetical protein
VRRGSFATPTFFDGLLTDISLGTFVKVNATSNPMQNEKELYLRTDLGVGSSSLGSDLVAIGTLLSLPVFAPTSCDPNSAFRFPPSVCRLRVGQR